MKTPKQRFVEDALGPTVVTIRPLNASSTTAEMEEAGAGEQAADRADEARPCGRLQRWTGSSIISRAACSGCGEAVMPAMGAGHSARQVFDLPEPTPLVVPIASMIAGAPAAGRAALVGPSGIGNPTLAQNIAHQAVIHGHTVLFTTAGQLLGNLAAPDSDSTLRRRLHHYVKLTLLVIDEVGYLSYSNRHADLLFELISRRFENKATRPIQGERKRGSRGFGPEWLA